MENLIHHLRELGFNSYESKVYLSLIKHHPATGYEVSKLSKIPQARAYDTLKMLESRGIVVSSGKKPITYIPISPKDLLNRCENSFSSSINYLKNNLPKLSDDFVEPILNISGKDLVTKHLNDLINNATKELFIEIASNELPPIEEALKNANERGVDVKVVGYNQVNLDFGLVYQHGLCNEIQESIGGRWVLVTADNIEGIMCMFHDCHKVPTAILTKNRGIVLIMKEVIIHDMYLLDVESKFGDSLTQAYGENLMSLREKILGKEFLFRSH